MGVKGDGVMELANGAVTDPRGVGWTVRRKWMEGPTTIMDGDSLVDVILSVGQLLCLLAWPFWFAAKFLGVPWKIVVERENREVGTERVRGWRASTRRMDEIRRHIGMAGGDRSSAPMQIQPMRIHQQPRPDYWYR
ncbi:hypothetical protein [Mycolicibacterium sp. HK-90]|uniref:hypothetical protein n=1 Tax=Mycolicibacterium sp. HK-90 TaxID=3056937 RepID=UPI00265A3CF3|nr:hypothetical protein [Mycolicibacterium sp. HK-90]WKG06053.1 hypothetical protein QU592_13685 [Mycolicibacterium sp. HK-90]